MAMIQNQAQRDCRGQLTCHLRDVKIGWGILI